MTPYENQLLRSILEAFDAFGEADDAMTLMALTQKMGELRAMLSGSDLQTALSAKGKRLFTFLDTAAGDGLEIGGVDAADLFIEIFGEPNESNKSN